MKKELIEYLEGGRNAVRDEFILSREKTGRSERILVTHPEIEDPLYALWRSTKKIQKNHELEETPEAKIKNTGGRQPYVMLMLKELVGLMQKGMPPEYAGYILYLSPYIEWGTGRLVIGRKKRQIKFADIKKVFGKCRNTTQIIISNLKANNLLVYQKEGYFISRNLIKRGVKNANQV